MNTKGNTTEQKEDMVYAGFWARLGAYLIDLVLVGMGQLVLRLILFLSFGIFWERNPLETEILFSYTAKDILLYLAGALYFVLCTYYSGATLGKKALNLKVVSADGTKAGFLDILYRETVGRFLSAVILGIGYILVGITREKTGIHDILCDTRVVYAKRIPLYTDEEMASRYEHRKVSGTRRSPFNRGEPGGQKKPFDYEHKYTHREPEQSPEDRPE